MNCPEKQSAWVSSRRSIWFDSALLSVFWARAWALISSPVRPWIACPNSCAITTSAAHLSSATIGTDRGSRLLK